MSDFNPYSFYFDAMYLQKVIQPFSITFNALKFLFETIQNNPAASFCFATGWSEIMFPQITLEVTLMGRDIVEKD